MKLGRHQGPSASRMSLDNSVFGGTCRKEVTYFWGNETIKSDMLFS